MTDQQQEQAAPVDWQAIAEQREQERDGAYRERAHLVAHLAAIHPSHIGYTDPNAIDWPVVTIETPAGQMSWHIAERDRDLFEHVTLVPSTHNVWDGHTTEQKYQRLRRLTAQARSAEAFIAFVADTIADHEGDEWANHSATTAIRAAITRHATGQHPGPEETCAAHDGPCFPDPVAKCPAHGDRECALCHRNPGNCTDDYGACGFWSSTGMHWDTCPNRVRGPLAAPAATEATGELPDPSWSVRCRPPGCNAQPGERCRRRDGSTSTVSHGERWREYDRQQAARAKQQPAEHCGHLSPQTLLTSPPTECVLPPGHTGSHADDRGCRWWLTPEAIDWRQRADQLAKLLTVILAEFRILPGTRTATAHVETETIDRWRATLDQHQEQPHA